eukprot:7167043-Prymnesium_polylepis.1
MAARHWERWAHLETWCPRAAQERRRWRRRGGCGSGRGVSRRGGEPARAVAPLGRARPQNRARGAEAVGGAAWATLSDTMSILLAWEDTGQ